MAVIERPETGAIHDNLLRDLSGSDSPWAVILLNDEVHTFDDVAFQLQKAIGCSLETGYAFAYTVHTEGAAKVFEGDLEACERVASVLEEIELKVRLQVQ